MCIWLYIAFDLNFYYTAQHNQTEKVAHMLNVIQSVYRLSLSTMHCSYEIVRN